MYDFPAPPLDMRVFHQETREQMQQMERAMRDMEAQTSRVFRRMEEDLDLLEDRRGGSGFTFRSAESRGDGYYYSESMVYHSGYQHVPAPAPASTIPLLFLACVSLGAFAAVARRLLQNYRLTRFKDGFKLPFVLLWPVLVLNARFRENFWRALRGEEDSQRPKDHDSAAI